MYRHYPSIVFGFHACDKEIGEKLVSGELKLKPSENDFDWLGHGMYFWENSQLRAEKYGEDLLKREKIKDPVVLGATINLGFCLDLLNSESLSLVHSSYRALKGIMRTANEELPKNECSTIAKSDDLLLRKLDCLVFNFLHYERKEKEERSFDSVRGVFWEGEPLYPSAGFKDKNHIQLCIKNPNCIKSFFWPIEEDCNHPPV